MSLQGALPHRDASEPLARQSDIDTFADALARYRSGEWDEERWTAFRLRFGVYGQRQPGVQMVRIKVPGGILPPAAARAIARANRRYAKGDIHLTTRQAVQVYFVPLDDAPALMQDLHDSGLTTREACGNTVRNMTSCALAGVCPRERVDAGKVAERLSQSWIRHPLVQHMPRKFKTSVSGCATDCGAASIHDLGLVAIEKDGQTGFRVYGGGGLGGVPRSATPIADFVTEDELPAVLEALIRLHQRFSNRKNRNAARIKFVVKRFGEDKFRELFHEEFARAKALPQRPFEPLEWRRPIDAPEPSSPGGVVWQHDGRMSVVVSPELGLLTADQLDALAQLAERFAFEGLRTTRDQNIAIVGVEAEVVQEVVDAVRALGLPVEENTGDVPDVVSCPGTTTCRIGITNSQNFGREILEQVRDYKPLPEVRVRISGCHNGCGLHHVGDFGFRGMAKKIDGRNAPHYQIFIGGNPRQAGEIGLGGPTVPARHAKEALKLLMDGFAETRAAGESVREWALRLGKGGLSQVLAPLAAKAADGDSTLFVDWGDSTEFAPPTITQAECAAGFAIDNLYRDLADDGLINLDRAIAAGARDAAFAAANDGLTHAARRLLVRLGTALEDDDIGATDVVSRVREAYAEDAEVLAALDAVVTEERRANGDLGRYREALAGFIDTVGEEVEKPVAWDRIDVSNLFAADPRPVQAVGGE